MLGYSYIQVNLLVKDFLGASNDIRIWRFLLEYSYEEYSYIEVLLYRGKADFVKYIETFAAAMGGHVTQSKEHLRITRS